MNVIRWLPLVVPYWRKVWYNFKNKSITVTSIGNQSHFGQGQPWNTFTVSLSLSVSHLACSKLCINTICICFDVCMLIVVCLFFGTYVYMVKHVNIKYEKYSHSRSYIMFPETIWDMCLTITNSNHQLKPLVQRIDSSIHQWSSSSSSSVEPEHPGHFFKHVFCDYQVVPQFGMAKLVLVSSTSDLWFIHIKLNYTCT